MSTNHAARATAYRRAAELVLHHQRGDRAGKRAELAGESDVAELADAFARSVDVLLSVQLGESQVGAYLAGNLRRLSAMEADQDQGKARFPQGGDS